jgi:predicted nucleic acid-binding protein
MIVVDSNDWADYFNGADTPYVDRLHDALKQEDDIAILPIIVTEVLKGLRSDTGFHEARTVLTALPVLYPDLECHVRAALLFRRLREAGVTVRGAVDCIIAQSCIEAGALLLSPDSGFRTISDHSELNLWQPD